MAPISDYYDDINRQTFYRLSKLVPMPEFVKGAAEETREDIKTLPPQVYADATNSKFPLHTKTATWLSQLYFLEAKHQYRNDHAAYIQGQIDKAASFFKIAGTVESAKTAWHQHMDAAPADLSDENYALVINAGDETIRRLPMPNAESVKAAADHLFGNRDKYPYDWRRVAARKILTKAAELLTVTSNVPSS